MATRRGQIKVCTGNKAAAYGVLLCKPDVVTVFPITPQTTLVESLANFANDGLLKAEIVEVEGEIAAMGVVAGAAEAGARVFCASSGAGLEFMHDTYLMASSYRIPVVYCNVSRELRSILAGEQDIMMVADCGWVQLHVENNQEILDSIILAYKLAEDPEILLPVAVCYDGWYLSHLIEAVEVPTQEDVNRFLPPPPPRPKLDPIYPMGRMHIMDEGIAEVRYKNQAALEKVKTKIETLDKEFGATFGRSYGGQIEEYRTDDADILLVTLGSCTGTAKVAVDRKREQGIKVGLIKVRLFRPFPKERLVPVLKGRKAIGVVDRNVCFGLNCGHLLRELKTAMYGSGINVPMVDFIGGLGGGDITLAHMEQVVDVTHQAAEGKPVSEVYWLQLEPVS